jgi:tripartite-type tricarboxylate transporter receptor subunit TctC
MSKRHYITLLAGIFAVICALPQKLAAQTIPAVITVVVPFAAGGPTDIVGRLMAREFGAALGRVAIVENVSGASGAIGSKRVALGPSDGSQLLLATNGTHATNLSLLPNGGGYDPVKEFAPIARLVTLQFIIIVRNELPAKNIAELIALAKKEPGRINYGSSSIGSASHLCMELFQTKAGIKLNGVHYRGAAPLMQDLLGGHIDALCAGVASVRYLVQAGKVRALGLASESRSTLMPDVPTLEEAGLKGVDADGWFGMFAPAGVPQALLDRYRTLALEIMKKDSAKEMFLQQGLVPDAMDAATFAKFQKEDIVRWTEVIKTANVKAE